MLQLSNLPLNDRKGERGKLRVPFDYFDLLNTTKCDSSVTVRSMNTLFAEDGSKLTLEENTISFRIMNVVPGNYLFVVQRGKKH